MTRKKRIMMNINGRHAGKIVKMQHKPPKIDLSLAEGAQQEAVVKESEGEVLIDRPPAIDVYNDSAKQRPPTFCLQ